MRLDDDLHDLRKVMGSQISLRADEGEPFEVGEIAKMGSRTTFHALEHSHLRLGERGRYGERSLVNGGPAEVDPTTTGERFRLGSSSVFFRSSAGDNVRVGCRSLVQQSSLPKGPRVPQKVVMIANEVLWPVEWGSCKK